MRTCSMYGKEDSVDWIHMVEFRDELWALMNTVFNLIFVLTCIIDINNTYNQLAAIITVY